MIIITACIRNTGTPTTGLTPTISGWNTQTGVNVLNAVAMTELGTSGVYIYQYSGGNQDKNYAFLVDGGETITDGDERYLFFTKGSLLYDIQNAEAVV